MKNLITLILGSLIFCASCSDPASNTSTANTFQPVETQTYRSVGVIKAADAEAGKVTIDHEEIPGYMAAMEMTEPVADKALLDGLNVGAKVEFELLREGSKLMFTKFKKIGEVAIINAAEIYKTSCAECHGRKGEGAKKGIPLTSGHALDHTEADFLKTVANGKTKKKDKEMPAFRDKLTPDEIKEVVRFVREVIQKDMKRNEGHKH